jgi:hypothetical protein|tara:strand:- start:1419 stop:2141 length:723 start_codon:yes stop_codon:yes gene_type:complete
MNKEHNTLITIRDALQIQIDNINAILNNLTPIYNCLSCNKTFDDSTQFLKHNNSKAHSNKIEKGQGTKCSNCQNTFYGKNISLHVEDGRCDKSRTCKLCGKICSNMVDKSRCRLKCKNKIIEPPTSNSQKEIKQKNKEEKWELQYTTRVSQPDKDDNDLSICEKVDRANKSNLIPLDIINETDTYTSLHKHYNRNDVNYLPNSLYKLFLENEKLSYNRSMDDLVEHPSNLIYIYEPILVL